MAIKHKSSGAYTDVVGVFHKRAGAYEAVQGIYAKAGGVYGRVDAAPVVPLPLDSLTAGAAYSVRRLRTDYTGPLLRVRRSSDNAEQDIGYGSDNWLDEAALLTFVGAGSGFVKTWYDQSGNARDASQTTTGSQPRIVNTGTMDVANSNPTLVFDGSNDTLFAPDGNAFLYAAGSATAFVIAKAASQTGTFIFGEAGATIVPSYYPFYTDGSACAVFHRNDANTALIDRFMMEVAGVFDSTVKSVGFRDSGSSVLLTNNGTPGPSKAYTRSTTTLSRIYIGSERGGSAFNGAISEVVAFPSLIPTSEYNAFGATQASGWGISINPI